MYFPFRVSNIRLIRTTAMHVLVSLAPSGCSPVRLTFDFADGGGTNGAQVPVACAETALGRELGHAICQLHICVPVRSGGTAVTHTELV
jgi:hypothetical protein